MLNYILVLPHVNENNEFNIICHLTLKDLISNIRKAESRLKLQVHEKPVILDSGDHHCDSGFFMMVTGMVVKCKFIELWVKNTLQQQK